MTEPQINPTFPTLIPQTNPVYATGVPQANPIYTTGFVPQNNPQLPTTATGVPVTNLDQIRFNAGNNLLHNAAIPGRLTH